MGLPFYGMALPINLQVLGDEWVGDSPLLGVEDDVWFSHTDWGDRWPYDKVHHRYDGEDLQILWPLMDHWRSVEDSGACPRLGTFFLGSTSTHLDDGTGELVSTIQIQWLYFCVHSSGLVCREGSFVAPKDSVGALRAMRATTDAVGRCAGQKWRWRVWPLLDDHGHARVETNSTRNTRVSIHWFGLLTWPEYDDASMGWLWLEVCFCIMFYGFES